MTLSNSIPQSWANNVGAAIQPRSGGLLHPSKFDSTPPFAWPCNELSRRVGELNQGTTIVYPR